MTAMLTSSVPYRHQPFLVVSSLCLLTSLFLCFPSSSFAAVGDDTDNNTTIIWHKGGSYSPLSTRPDLAAENNVNGNNTDWKIMPSGVATSLFPTMDHRLLPPSCQVVREKKYEKKSKMLAKFIQKQIHPRPTIESIKIQYVQVNDRRRRSLVCRPSRAPQKCNMRISSGSKPFTAKQVRAVVQKIKRTLRGDAYKDVFSSVVKVKLSGNKKRLFMVIKFQPSHFFE